MRHFILTQIRSLRKMLLNEALYVISKQGGTLNTFIVLAIVVIVVFVLVWLFKSEPKTEEELAIIEADTKLLKEKLTTCTLESIKISPCLTSPRNRFSSKFGGYPAWPCGRVYPTDKRGKPLRLLAQFNLEDLPKNNILPDSGILQFFIANDSSWGLEFESKKRTIDQITAESLGYKVVYHTDMPAQLENLEQELGEIDYSGFPYEGECSIRFEIESSLCNPSDYRFEKIVGNADGFHDDSIDDIFEIVDEGGCRIGGYATFTQDDPRNLKSDENWLLLFQMDSVSENGFDIMWGDAGVANFFILPEDLSELNFNRIWYNWDCC